MTRSQVSRTAAKKKADTLFSLYIRARAGDRCELAPWFPRIACNGRLQCCHVISRRYMAVRWDPDNAVAGCAAHHLYGTHHPLEWTAAAWHHLNYAELRRRALEDEPMDPVEVLIWLTNDSG